MKFKFILKNSMKTIMIVLGIIIVIGAGFTISKLSIYGVDAFSIVSLVFAIIVEIMLLLLLFNTNYVFKEKNLNVNLGIMTQKINYNDIIAIKNYVKHQELFLIFKPNKPKEEGDLSQIMINIKPELYTDFVEALKLKNNMIVYDEIDQNYQEEQNEQ